MLRKPAREREYAFPDQSDFLARPALILGMLILALSTPDPARAERAVFRLPEG